MSAIIILKSHSSNSCCLAFCQTSCISQKFVYILQRDLLAKIHSEMESSHQPHNISFHLANYKIDTQHFKQCFSFNGPYSYQPIKLHHTPVGSVNGNPSSQSLLGPYICQGRQIKPAWMDAVLPYSLPAGRMVIHFYKRLGLCESTHKATKELVERNSTTKQIPSSPGSCEYLLLQGCY